MFGMLSVLAELRRELIVASTHDGLAAARARDRRPRLSADQAALTQELYDGGKHTIQQIAAIFGVPRSTVYGYLDKTHADPRAAPAACKGCTISTRATRPPSYLTRLLAELDQIHADYSEVLSASAIRNIDPGPGVYRLPLVGLGGQQRGTRSVTHGAATTRPRLGAPLPAAVPPPDAHRQRAPR